MRVKMRVFIGFFILLTAAFNSSAVVVMDSKISCEVNLFNYAQEFRLNYRDIKSIEVRNLYFSKKGEAYYCPSGQKKMDYMNNTPMCKLSTGVFNSTMVPAKKLSSEHFAKGDGHTYTNFRYLLGCAGVFAHKIKEDTQ